MKLITAYILTALVLPFAGEAQSKDTIHYTISFSGQKSGFMKQWKNEDGSFTEWYQFNDRGRGDSTVTRYKMDENGYVIQMEGRGVDYFKKPVREKFRYENGLAQWKNNAEKGQNGGYNQCWQRK